LLRDNTYYIKCRDIPEKGRNPPMKSWTGHRLYQGSPSGICLGTCLGLAGGLYTPATFFPMIPPMRERGRETKQNMPVNNRNKSTKSQIEFMKMNNPG